MPPGTISLLTNSAHWLPMPSTGNGDRPIQELDQIMDEKAEAQE